MATPDHAARATSITRRELPPGVTEGWANGALTAFVPGVPTNMKNKVGHWSKRHRWAKQWRARTASRLSQWRITHGPIGPWPWSPYDPKRVLFTIYGPSRFDDDNRALVASPCRDALQDALIIDSDGNPAHSFFYAQAAPTRKAGSVYGIAIRIELAKTQEVK